MHKVRIIYYEGFAHRDLAIRRAQERGDVSYRPYSVSVDAEYPIVPRPGDHVVFPLDEKHSKYYGGEIREDGRKYHSAVVQWVELNHGSDALYVVCTDEGHKGRGIYDGNYDADRDRALAEFGT